MTDLGKAAVFFAAVALAFTMPSAARGDMWPVAIVALNGWSGFVLARALTGHRVVSVACGLMLALDPIALTDLAAGRARPACVFALCLPLVGLLRAFHLPDSRTPWLTALGVGAAALIAPHFGVSLVLLAIALTGWRAWTDPPAVRDAWMPRLRVLALLVGLGLLVLVIAAIARDRSGDTIFPSFPLGQQMRLALATRTIVDAAPDIDCWVRPSRAPVFPAYGGVVLVLAVIGTWLYTRRIGHAWFWTVAALIFLAIALGPLVKIGGDPVPALVNPVYLLCYKGVPFLSHITCTAWFVSVTRVCLCAALACGLVACDSRVPPSRAMLVALALMVALQAGDLAARGYLPLSPPAVASGTGGTP